jgi:hypothetical protein
MSTSGPIWQALRDAAHAFPPSFSVLAEDARMLRVTLQNTEGRKVTVAYRSQRGLFLRSYLLVVETEFPGIGPAAGGELVLRRRRLHWRRPQPSEGRAWAARLNSPEVSLALRPLQIERLTLRWRPEVATWRLALETLAGSVTVTFFPPLTTPAPLSREEADAFIRLTDLLAAAAVETVRVPP